MAKFFLSRRYRPNIWPFWVQIPIELGLIVALLTFSGIAAPNLYRTKLWNDGALNGFNSSPSAGLYAAANYRPYKTPQIWSQFITNYNLVIVVLAMFLMLTKGTMYMLHVFPPIVSAFVHTILIALFSVSISVQTSSDMTDPKHPQKGAPWYITKSCSVSHDPGNIGYCKQAKAEFYCFVFALALYVSYWTIGVWSCFPSKQQRAKYEEKQRARKEKYAMLESPEDRYRPAEPVGTTGSRLGALNPLTPRTLAFNILGGTKDLPLRTNKTASNQIQTRTPAFIRMDGEKGVPSTMTQGEEIQPANAGKGKEPMYFPPPPMPNSRR